MPARSLLRSRLTGDGAVSGCPFLIESSCVIHPLRPMGCRQFNVFTAPCAPGEDPYYTRREDVLQPDQAYLDRAFAAVIAFYNLKRESDASGAIKMIRAQIMNLRSFDWAKLAALMDKASPSTGSNREPVIAAAAQPPGECLLRITSLPSSCFLPDSSLVI